MRYCPKCGGPVKEGEAACGRCGAALARKEKRSPGPDRGLKLAIATLASLWVITAVLWMLWPRLFPAASPDGDANAILSGGLSQTLASVPASPPGSDAVPMQQPSPSPTPSAQPTPAEPKTVLALDSWWYGRLLLSNYEGDDPPSSSDMEVWGYIGQEDDGRAFFGVYPDWGVTDREAALIYYPIELRGDSFVPIITQRDGFVLARYLDPRDEGPLTLQLKDGKLDLEYHYVTSIESCDVSCLLTPVS